MSILMRNIIFSTLFCQIFSSHAETPKLDTSRKTQSRFEQLKSAEAAVLDGEIASRGKSPNETFEQLAEPLQNLAEIRTFTGDVLGALVKFDRFEEIIAKINNRPLKSAISLKEVLQLQDSTAEDAITAIVKQAKERQIVILNEAHHIPLHRAFAMKLARELRKIGYEYLACETFDPAPLANGYVTALTGYYSREPMYANFLRDAQKDQWKFVSYEAHVNDPALSNDERLRLRELGQANNLIDNIFSKDPKAKVFIYLGYGHGSKKSKLKPETEYVFMAEHLKRLTGIDALSIDQATMYAHANPNVEHPLYRAALKKNTAGKAFVLKSSKNVYQVFGDYEGSLDMQIVHPSYSVNPKSRRVEWLTSLAGLIPRDIPVELLPVLGRRLIYARDRHVGADAVPLDVILVEAGKPIPKLILPSGEFRFSYGD